MAVFTNRELTEKDFLMALGDSEDKIPLIVIKPEGQYQSKWMASFKIFMIIIFTLVIYGYLYLYISSLIVKSKDLTRIAEMTQKIEKRLNRLFEIDSNMSLDLEQLHEMIDDNDE